jgi:AraC-like DNA-binding protein
MSRIVTDLEAAVRRRIVRGEPGRTRGITLARGEGWSVEDYVCTRGPEDRPFAEQHDAVQVAVVLAGTFQYRSPGAHAMLTPGSLLLGNDGESFECDHEHAPGDRCVAFRFTPAYFDRIAADAGLGNGNRRFGVGRLPSLRGLGWMSASTAAGVLGANHIAWDELGVEVAAQALRVANGMSPRGTPSLPRGAAARVTATVRAIERDPAAPFTLQELASRAGLSVFHYLRRFQQATGLTPHQFVLRARLREAGTRLVTGPARIGAVALDAGFEDLSNFNHAFRAEFGVSPRAFGRTWRGA